MSATDPIATDLVFLARIVLAGVLSFLIGWEREEQGSAAGDRTHALVGMASAAFASIGVDSFPQDAGRIIQGVVTGVGFLGAGMILKDGGVVTGLTTAAGIWAVAAVGVMVGAGEYFMGVSLAAVIVVVLAKERLPILRRVGYRHSRAAHVRVGGDEAGDRHR